MSRQITSIKTVPPHLASVLVRPRLLEQLDAGCRQGIVWVMGPPGAGKTTLVSDYISTHSAPPLWYRMDREDQDPATFFHYLSLAAQRAYPHEHLPLPVLTRERQPGLVAFARRYFETLSTRTRQPSHWIFDDFQELPDDGPTCALLCAAMEAASPDLAIIVISRNPPPSAMARLQVHGRVTVIEGGALAFLPDEALALARTRKATLDEAAIAVAHAATEGWAAGLALIFEESRTVGAQGLPPPDRSRGLLFDYFMNEIFEGLPADTRDILMTTSLVPNVTPSMAAALSGHEHAGRVLATLARRNYFTVRLATDPETYTYHALFGAFLRARAAEGLGPERLAQTRIAAARLLDQAQAPDLAATLLIEAQDWATLEDLCIRQAPALLAQGRTAVLTRWIAAVPAPMRETSPWLAYWQGACETSWAASRALFARAYALSEGSACTRVRFLSWVGVAESIYLSWDDLASGDAWLIEFDTLIARCPTFPDDATERRVVSAIVALMVIRRPQHPMLPVWVQRLRKLLDGTHETSERLAMVNPLLTYYLWTGDFAQAGLLIETLRRQAHAPATPPTQRLVFAVMEGAYLWHTGGFTQCYEAVEAARALGVAEGLHGLDQRLAAQSLYAALSASDSALAKRLLAEIDGAHDKAGLLHRSHYHHQATWFHMVTGDWSRARGHSQAALALARGAGSPFPRALCHLHASLLATASGKPQEALPHAHAVARMGSMLRSALLTYASGLVLAQCALALGNEEHARTILAAAFRLGSERGYVNFDGWLHEIMVSLCAFALTHDIEPAYARTLTHTRGLRPRDSTHASAHWPWPVRIHTFGGFQVEIADKPLATAGKGPLRPMDLLKTLIALGGERVPEPQLAETLWPDAEGDVAHGALATTLHRLRSLLGDRRALRLEGRRISLDRGIVWLDTWAFEGALEEGARTVALDTAGLAAQERALQLYCGAFLPDEEAACIIGARERLRSKFLRHRKALSLAWEQTSAPLRALEGYQRAIEVEPFAEEVYRDLMAFHCRAGQYAAAAAIYERYAKLLDAAFARKPGTEIERLYRGLPRPRD